MSLRLLSVGTLLLALSACSQDNGSAPAAQSSGDDESTSLSIDTDNGSMSFESKDSGDSTSISIGDGASGQKEGKSE